MALIERDARAVGNLRKLDHLRALLTLLAHQTAQLLNVNALATHLGIRRETVENHFAALERPFLVGRVAAWHSNEARRLLKAPKGESFVVQQRGSSPRLSRPSGPDAPWAVVLTSRRAQRG